MLAGILDIVLMISLACIVILVGLMLYYVRGRIETAEKQIADAYTMINDLGNEIKACKISQSSQTVNVVGPTIPAPAPQAPADDDIVPIDLELYNMVGGAEDDGEDDFDEEGEDSDDTDEEDEDGDDEDGDDEECKNNGMCSWTIETGLGPESGIHVVLLGGHEPATAPAPEGPETPRVQELDDTGAPAEIELDIRDADEADEAPAPAPAAPATEDYKHMNVQTLRKIAAEKGFSMESTGKLKKAELISLLI